MMSSYIRFSENYTVNKLIPNTDNPYKYIKNKDLPYFISMATYDEDQYKQWQKTNSLAGMSGSKTNKIWADFDSISDLKKAFSDAVIFVNRLVDKGLKEEEIQISFSGSKGISVLLQTTHDYTTEQVKAFVFDLGKDLETLDKQIYDQQRIFRLNYTKNEKSGLYKIPITYEELVEANIVNIKEMAKNPATEEELQNILTFYKVSDFKILDQYLNVTKLPELKIVPVDTSVIDWQTKPKFLTNCRWSLQNGFFKEGQRSSALICLAATYKNLGYSKEITYRMLKGVAEVQANRNDQDRFPDVEIYNNVVLQVYSDRWKNGQFSCREEGNFLHDYCKTLGDHSCSHVKKESDLPYTMDHLGGNFKHFVKNIDKNTILTGLPSIDKYFPIVTGSNIGVIGAASSGKSSLALNILNNTSKQGVVSVFASLDMHPNRMFEKVMYKISGLRREELYKVFQNDNEEKLIQKLKEEFGNVYFFSKSSPTVEEIKNYTLDVQEQTGTKVKMIMLDYFERVTSDMTDDTAASKRVAGELQDLVQDLDIALINLVQPNKFALTGGPDKPIYDYTKIKGSSFIYQSMRQILSIWRPYFSPQNFVNDHYMQMAILKNDLGELKEFAFHWDGPKGEIGEMEDIEKDEFYHELRNRESKETQKSDGWP